MNATPTSVEETDRLLVLRDLHLLDTESQPRFDRLTRLVARHFAVPVALITLVDEQRIWFLSHYGLDLTQIPRSTSFSAYVVSGEEILQVENARLDPRFSSNSLVAGPPHFQFYAGCPIKTPGNVRVGTISLFDYYPRQLSLAELEDLRDFAGMVEQEFEKDLNIEPKLLEADKIAGALRQSEARFHAFMKYSPAAAYVVDDQGRILYVNEAYLRAFKLTSEQTIGKYCSDLFPPEISAYHRRQDQQVLQTGLPLEEVETIPQADGTAIYWLGCKFLIEDGSGRRLVGGVGLDITQHRQSQQALSLAQEQLLQAQKMESVGRLAGGVAHDFNNLLTAITGYTELVSLNFEETDPVQPDLEEIRKAAERATNLTRQLLAFSRRQVLQPKVLDLNNVVIDINKLLQRVLGEDIDLTLKTAPQPCIVWADPTQLEQILLNLAVNARDAMPNGGKLVLQTDQLELDETYVQEHFNVKPGTYVLLSVTDTGCGMDAETQARIFEPFFTTKPQGQGTGLGLSTVYGIVQQSEGYIWVYSEVGVGTTFKIYLPVLKTEEKVSDRNNPRVLTQELPDVSDKTVLLVEDEAGVRGFTRRVLENKGFRVLEAGRADEALRLGKQSSEKIHLLITDVILPGLNGRELSQQLLQLYPDLEILYISGYNDVMIANQGVLSENSPFLEKPFSTEKLLQKVYALLVN
jgi:PAS domain S-box-containing protein